MTQPLPSQRPDLPQPLLQRWQPLRLGLVELFHYDSEEFWFRDGHLLLRGNNGTGKSKVLSLTLPFLFDARLNPARIEPDGDPGKKMAWNLLLGRHERRMGYTWIEFGRIGDDGTPCYLTLGCGLSAAAARPSVESWFFLMDKGRIGQDLWLIGHARVVLTRERLRDALEPLGGHIFPSATEYRRAVDERLFQLGAVRYGALMDTLTQLRQPQLSRKPDEGSLSQALTEALPPLSADLLADVADALNQLETYRHELAEYEALEQAVVQFSQRYQRYAATQARRQSRTVRSAQTSFDNASRELNVGRQALQESTEAERVAIASLEQAARALASARMQLETLQGDPAMASAKRLDEAERDAKGRADDAQRATKSLAKSEHRLQQEHEASATRAQRQQQAANTLSAARSEATSQAEQAGLFAALQSNLLGADTHPHEVLAPHALDAAALDVAAQELRRATGARREQIDLLLQHCDAAERAQDIHARAQEERDLRRDELEDAAERRARADEGVTLQATTLQEAWQAYLDELRELVVPNVDPVLDDLATWTLSLRGGNPARAALLRAQQAAAERLARRAAELDVRQRTLQEERQALEAESERLEQGEDTHPLVPHWRDEAARAGRAGSPLWQLIDFRPQVTDDARAGLEAALQASGLLDAWVTPDGGLLADNESPVPHDAQWLTRPRQEHSLADWLQAADQSYVPPALVHRLLEGVACSTRDASSAEAWISPDGRFRLSALAGTLTKPAAEFIGYAARYAARARRLKEIAALLNELAARGAELAKDQAGLESARRQADQEWHSAPGDDALRASHAEATGATREYEAARQRLDLSERRWREASDRLDEARMTLARDAEDMRLPATRESLHAVASALQSFTDAMHALTAAAHQLREATLESVRQRARESEAEAQWRADTEEAARRTALADEAGVRWHTLQDSLGAEVEAVQVRLAQARESVDNADKHHRTETEARRVAAESRARAEQISQNAEALLEQSATTRGHAIEQLQGFAATGLLATALPDLEQPPLSQPWTIESALTVARRTEQALTSVRDDDEAWSRVQSQVSQDFTELGRSLTTLSHQAQAETSDYGMVVRIIYRNRPERPDQLGLQLADEIAQRRELLTAGEREVLENHLEAEIAAAIQKLLRDAEHQVQTINEELHKRPTSTGVRFRLQWQTLPEGGAAMEGAPVGLEVARRRLLNTSTDLWTAEDRRVVGEMLQQRIAAERNRADAHDGGSLLEQLARALDYRRWHRFRVQRWQDGQWRPLSGPASSGERALGLTVPLFAAVSSFYSQAGSTHSPRLVLLDEAFAGIDDAARAHCWALVREFDLDFVMTSEREWACSSELPGVAIAQLQRREGVDAVHVSRWVWDGRARRREEDPNRRFAPAMDDDEAG